MALQPATRAEEDGEGIVAAREISRKAPEMG